MRAGCIPGRKQGGRFGEKGLQEVLYGYVRLKGGGGSRGQEHAGMDRSAVDFQVELKRQPGVGKKLESDRPVGQEVQCGCGSER
jgi:hypothetical protein